MQIKQYKNHFITILTPIYDAQEAESFFYLILEEKHRLKRIDLALNPNLKLTPTEIKNWDIILKKLKNEIPIQYILGKTYFLDLEFEVNPNVLIPRPETEELINWIIKENKNSPKLKILDIGTGSGCIAITLAKKMPQAQVFALDVSEKAIETAQKNAQNNNVSITFIIQNILETSNLLKNFDIIVSNPPYVRELEKQEIKNNVLNHEPHLALFVTNQNPLIFYEKIANLAQKNLTKNGKLYFEINQYLGNEMTNLLEKLNFKNICLQKDFYGNNRMMMCQK